MSKIKKSEYDAIINLYDSGLKQIEIAKMYNVSSTTIANVLADMKKNRGIRTKQVSEEEVSKMYDMYLTGKSMKDVAKEFGVSYTCVASNFSKRGLKVRELSGACAKYNIDKYYFDKIDTPNKAYIVGLLYADGCHLSNRDVVSITLQEQDVSVLNNIKYELKTDRPLYFVSSKRSPLTKNNAYMLVLSNKHIVNTLENLGLCSRKSLILEWPEWLPESLYRHFIRGYLDGDGCIYFNNKTHECKVYITSTEMFCNKIKQVIFNSISVNSSITKASCNSQITKTLNICGNRQVYRFLNWIYEGADLLIERKYEKYLNFIQYYQNINNSSKNNELVG